MREPNEPTMHDDNADQLDLLITRIIDANDAQAWSQFETLAARDKRAWQLLAETQQDALALREAVEVETQVAEHVEVRPGSAKPVTRTWRAGAIAGWAAAIALAVTWATREPNTEPPPTINAAGFNVQTVEDAIAAYAKLGREDGRVLGEVPQRTLLDYRQLAPDRGYEVIYVRPFVERRVIDDLQQLAGARDEFGRPVIRPASISSRHGWDG